MNDDKIFDIYKGLMDYLEEVLGPEYELVLQDLRGPMSVVDIRNPMDKSRRVGADVSNFARLVMSDPDKYDGIKFVTNYKGTNSSEYNSLSTSTMFIRGAGDKIIGMLCINSRLEFLMRIQSMLDTIIKHRTRINIGNDTFRGDILVDVSKIVSDGMSHLSGDPAQLTPEAKKALVGNLSDRGIFLVRGAVSEVAKRLDVSEQTVYRYMKESQT